MAKSAYLSRKLLNQLAAIEADSDDKAIYQPLSDKNLVRYAADMKDCSSIGLGVMGRNQFVTDDALVQKIIDMLH